MKETEKSFSKIKKNYLNFLNKQEVTSEPFQDKLGQLQNFYLPICNYIFKSHKLINKTIVIGLSGGQGAGKTTISNILKIILKTKFNLNVICFSIDNFYKTLKERKKELKNIHKLFITRGVPGTHDINLIKKFIKDIKKNNFKKIYVPQFDKSKDDRLPKTKWKKINKKPDIIIFEGWCVGAKPQNNKKLVKPCNILEKKYDKKLIWRKKVNNELKNGYKELFKLIDKLIFLKVPGLKYVYKWRLLQEQKLKIMAKGNKTMSVLQIKKFIMYYERITLQMIKDLSVSSDIIVRLDRKHKLNSIKFN